LLDAPALRKPSGRVEHAQDLDNLTMHLVMSPLEFMPRLAALVPRPGLHLIRLHGVLAPHAKPRALVVPQVPEAPAQAAQKGRKRAAKDAKKKKPPNFFCVFLRPFCVVCVRVLPCASHTASSKCHNDYAK
jgi:hypothetical protein